MSKEKRLTDLVCDGARGAPRAVDRVRASLTSALCMCFAGWALYGSVAASQEAGADAGRAPTSRATLAGPVVYGTVIAATGSPVVHALVQGLVRGPGSSDTTTTDSAGTYVLGRLAPGSSRLEITASGFEPLTLGVVLPPIGRLRVNVILTPAPSDSLVTVLPLVHVTALEPGRSLELGHLPLADTAGVWRWHGDVASAPETSGEPDVFRLLVSDPRAMMRADGYGGTPVEAVNGGIPTRVLVDGLPMWNPVHGGPSRGALDPDVVGDLSVHQPASSSRYGNALAGTITLTTREMPSRAVSAGAALGPVAARGWLGAPVRIGSLMGGLLVAGRQSVARLFPDRSDSRPILDRWDDGLAVLSLHSHDSELQIVAVGTSDNQSADLDDAVSGAKTDRVGASGRDATLQVPLRSSTIGGTWTQHLSGARTVVTRLWDARMKTTTRMGSSATRNETSSALGETGMSTELRSPEIELGASLESVRSSYLAAAPLERDSDATRGPAALGSSSLHSGPTVIAAYAERKWGSAQGGWAATSGIRVAALPHERPLFEPRLSASLQLSDGVVASAGYAGTHEFIQSVSSVISAAGPLVPLTFPIAAGPSGAPVAAAQTVSVDLTDDYAAGVRLSVGAYDRSFQGVIAPTTLALLSAGTNLDVVGGRTLGLATSALRTTGGVTAKLSYGVQRTALLRSTTYFPALQLAQNVAAAISWRAGGGTTFRAFGSAGTTPLLSTAPDVQGPQDDRVADNTTMSTPSRDEPRMVQYGLPVYSRVDFGVVHDWRRAPMGDVQLSVTLANVFNHSNVAALLPSGPEGSNAPQPSLMLTPRSLIAELAWHR